MSSDPPPFPAVAPKPPERGTSTSGTEAKASGLRNWVPIRSLGPRHRPRILTHLLALNEADRYLRFGYAANESQISKYVDMLDFERDEIFGIFNRHLDVVAMAHLAYADDSASTEQAEFGVSVQQSARGRGFGQRLFDHAVLHARNRGSRTLFIHALSENAAMLKIARRAGARIRRDGSESEAWLELPEDTVASHVGEIVGTKVAEWDYQLKRHVHQLNSVLEGISDVKAHIHGGSSVAKE